MKPFHMSFSNYEKLFPFSFVVDLNGNILNLASSIAKLLKKSNTEKLKFDDYFYFVRPQKNLFDVDVKNLIGEMVLIKSKFPDFGLMGQIIYVEEESCLHFCMSLVAQDAEKMGQIGLNFNDFAIQDQVFDFLLLYQSQKISMKETEELNKKLIKANEAANKASEMKSNFLANMSHELRTPMNGVLGMASILLETEISDQQREYLQTIMDSGENMLNLINDILDLSKIEAGHITIENLPLSLPELLNEVIKIVWPTADKKKIPIHLDMQSVSDLKLMGDPHRLKQIMLNLLSNALKFTSHGFINIKVELLERVSDFAIIQYSVQDTGIGMTQQVLSKIFKPFVQGDSSMNKVYGGTGLGLSICKKLVEAMGGQILVKSQVGVGSEFIFTTKLILDMKK